MFNAILYGTRKCICVYVKKDIKDDNVYLVSTSYSRFGILVRPIVLDELTISDISFCDREFVIEDNILLDRYGIEIYVNPLTVTEESFQTIKKLVKKHNYGFDGT